MNIMTVRAATPFIFRRKSDQKIQIAENRQFFLLFVEGLRGSGFRPEASQPSITNIKTQQDVTQGPKDMPSPPLLQPRNHFVRTATLPKE